MNRKADTNKMVTILVLVYATVSTISCFYSRDWMFGFLYILVAALAVSQLIIICKKGKRDGE